MSEQFHPGRGRGAQLHLCSGKSRRCNACPGVCCPSDLLLASLLQAREERRAREHKPFGLTNIYLGPRSHFAADLRRRKAAF